MDRDPRTMWTDGGPDDAAAIELFRPRHGKRASCPPPELVQAARAGVLPEPLQARVNLHVERCSLCRVLADALDDETVGPLADDERARILTSVRAVSSRVAYRRPLWQWCAAAAYAGVVIAGLALAWQSRSRPVPPGRVAEVLRLEQPGGRGGPNVLLRSSRRPGEAEDLARALEPFRTNDYAEVVRRLRAVIARHPESAVGHFYLGVSQMFLGANRDAARTLQKAKALARGEANLEREIDWYLSLAYYRSGQSTRATESLSTLCSAAGQPRAAQACVALRALHGPLTLSGVVTDVNGAPLAGVALSEWFVKPGVELAVAVPIGLSTTTDERGRYSVTGDLVSGAFVIWMARKPGYFSIGHIRSIVADAQIDFVMNPWVYVALGDVIRGTVKPGDMVCGDPNERCHYFAVKAPAAGSLEVAMTSSGSRQEWDLYVETPAGEVFGPMSQLPLRVTIPVEADATYQIRVLRFVDSPGDYELTTRLR
jgi:hypothetical protein